MTVAVVAADIVHTFPVSSVGAHDIFIEFGEAAV